MDGRKGKRRERRRKGINQNMSSFWTKFLPPQKISSTFYFDWRQKQEEKRGGKRMEKRGEILDYSLSTFREWER